MSEEQLVKENTFLRGLIPALKVPCVYCGLENMALCSRGLPGCPMADDIFCAEDEFCRELLEKVRKLEKI